MKRLSRLLRTLVYLTEGTRAKQARALVIPDADRKSETVPKVAKQALDLMYDVLRIAMTTVEELHPLFSGRWSEEDAARLAAGDDWNKSKWERLEKAFRKLAAAVKETGQRTRDNFFDIVARLDQQTAEATTDPSNVWYLASEVNSALREVQEVEELVIEVDELRGDLNLDDVPQVMSDYEVKHESASSKG